MPYLLTDAAQQAGHREAARSLAHVICVSKAVADSHSAAGDDRARMTMVHNGVAPHDRLRLGYQWDRRRLANATVDLLRARGPEIQAQLITHVVSFDEAPGFIARLVGQRPEFLQIVFKVAD